MIWGANQWTGFYMITTSVMKGLIQTLELEEIKEKELKNGIKANITAQKIKFSFKEFMCKCDQNRHFPTDLVTFIEEILNGKLHFLSSAFYCHTP